MPGGLVYSTDPSFKLEEDNTEETIMIPIAQQKITIKLDTKQRAGKVVTLIQGFSGNKADIEDVGKKLKSFCGTGGSVKEQEIIIQGDNRDKILLWLHKQGFSGAQKI